MLRCGDRISLSESEIDWLGCLTQEPNGVVRRLKTVQELNRFLDRFEDLFREDTPKLAKYFRQELDKFRVDADAA